VSAVIAAVTVRAAERVKALGAEEGSFRAGRDGPLSLPKTADQRAARQFHVRIRRGKQAYSRPVACNADKAARFCGVWRLRGERQERPSGVGCADSASLHS
jgi:hypothetical protein